jgi:hypothetical protein
LASTPGPKKKKTIQQQQQQPEPKKLSYLESLPAELLEQIFLECLEFNLPRASLHIARSLSREQLYRSLIIYALWSDPDWSHDEPPSDKAVAQIFRPILYTPLLYNHRPFQEAVLSCRWATLERVKSCSKDLAFLTLTRWLFGHGKHAEGLNIDPGELDAIAMALENRVCEFNVPFYDEDLTPGISWTIHCVNYPSSKGPEFEGEYWLDGFQKDSPRPAPYHYHPVSIFSIPNRLLKGDPWTDQKVQFLRLLGGWAHLYMYQDPLQIDWGPPGPSFNESKMQDGIEAAILQQNGLALDTLLKLRARSSMSVRVPILERHWLAAVRQSEDPAIFKLIMSYATPESLPAHDAEITEWAIQLKEKGDPFGSYLLDAMADRTLAFPTPQIHNYGGGDHGRRIIQL